jgi:hypothetical protein
MLRRRIFVYAVRAALVLGISGAVWSVYRHLPDRVSEGDATTSTSATQTTLLRVVLRGASDEAAKRANVEVELYPVDVAQAQSAFERLGKRANLRFKDFLKNYMGNKKMVTAKTDARGEAVLNVPPGDWWIQATVGGAETLSWRIPVQISDREQTIELTNENAYTRERNY